jgi:hypothetical protein
MSKQLNEPITERGILNTNFFNGRLLTAQDLKTDQDAERSQRWQLGQGIGEGVIEGFEVSLVSPGTTGTLPVVAITKGLALNRNGQILTLPDDDQVTLVRQIDLPPPEAGIFGDCGLPTSSFTNLEKGAYLLVVRPASGFREKAPMRNVPPNDALAGCGSKYVVEGVQFELIKLDTGNMTSISQATRTQIQDLMTQSDVPSLSKLRNLLAHLCFGTEELLKIAFDPFKQTSGESSYATYGAVDFMRSRSEVTNCKVPLALIYWDGGGIEFVDMWSVRRRVTPGPPPTRLPPLLGERRASEGEAVIRQFQEHVESLRTRAPFPEIVMAGNYFRYLPPGGVLPVAQGGQKGFSVNTFFSGIVRRVPEFIDGSILRALLREAVNYQPIDVTNGEMIWLYKVRQNEKGPDGGAPAQPYVVFASPHVPYKATARFDVDWWDFSNYARGTDGPSVASGSFGFGGQESFVLKS